MQNRATAPIWNVYVTFEIQEPADTATKLVFDRVVGQTGAIFDETSITYKTSYYLDSVAPCTGLALPKPAMLSGVATRVVEVRFLDTAGRWWIKPRDGDAHGPYLLSSEQHEAFLAAMMDFARPMKESLIEDCTDA
jgi:hypothetical protein